MKKKVLSEIALYTGEVKRPKGYEVNRSQIKADIFQARLENKTVSDNPFDYRFFDYDLKYSKEMGYVIENIQEYYKLNFNRSLEVVSTFGNILEYREQSFSRMCVDVPEKNQYPDLVMVYGVSVNKESTSVVIEYDDNKYKNQTWFKPIEDNEFAMFPSSQKFFITGNTAHEPNVFLIVTFKIV